MTQKGDVPLRKETHATKKLQGLMCVERTPGTPGDSGGVGQRIECKMIGNGYLLGLRLKF